MAELHPFQHKGVSFLWREERALLADAPRLGKAVQSMSAAEGRTLIVATRVILDGGGWQQDLQAFRPDLDAELTSYSLLNDRDRVLGSGGKPVSRVTERLREAWGGHWDTLILDEVHHAKERHTKWTIAALAIARESNRVYLLSGTPIPNWAHELFTILQMLYPGDKRFTSYWRWIGEWFDTTKSFYNMHAIEIGDLRKGATWDEFMQSNLGTKFLRRTWAEAGVEMPPYDESIQMVKMTSAQAAAYKSMKKDYIAKFADSEVKAWTTGAQTVRLAQITTGLESLGGEERGSGKLDAVRELLEDYQGEPVVLFCHFRNTARALQKVASLRGLRVGVVMGQEPNQSATLRAFQEGELDVLVGTIDSVSEGLQMWRANVCIRVERVWRPTANQQAQDRLAFIGKTTPVRVIDLVTEKTVDERMLGQLKEKTDQQMHALSAGQLAKLL